MSAAPLKPAGVAGRAAGAGSVGRSRARRMHGSAKEVVRASAPAWMATFADLVTLLMCFFVLIISVSSPDQRKLGSAADSLQHAFGLAQQIVIGEPAPAPPAPASPASAAAPGSAGEEVGGAFGRQPLWQRLNRRSLNRIEGDLATSSSQPLSDEQQFARLEERLHGQLKSTPALAKLAEHLEIERVAEGLRIQMLDQAQLSMFPLGGAAMLQPARDLLQQVVSAIQPLPHRIRITGHTDGLALRRFGGYDNWSLSLDRADATRRVLLAGGLDPRRIESVIGKADTELLAPDDPAAPRNRRITMLLLRNDALPADPAAKPGP